MKTLVLMVMICTLAVNVALADENWTPRLPGVTEGLASGALPPEGFYFMNTQLFASLPVYNNSGNKAGVNVDVVVEAPTLFWSTGMKIFGADFGMAITQPIDYVNTVVTGVAIPGDSMSSWGVFNTVVAPAELSWELPNNFHVSTALHVYIPDGKFDKSPASGGSFNGVTNSMGFWSFQPSVAVSWLKNGWNATANFSYDFNLKNDSTGYSSGSVLDGDYTLTKKIDKFMIGIGGYSVNQLQNDRSDNPVAQASIDAAGGNKVTKYAVGPIVGFDIGPAKLELYANFGFDAKNTVSGNTYWTRLVVPMGGLE